MRGASRPRLGIGLLAAALAATGGCSRNDPGELISQGTCAPGSGSPSGQSTAVSGAGGSSGAAPTSTVLDQRVLDYNEALRTASFKLVGNAPTLQQILDLDNAAAKDKPAAYAAYIDQLMVDTRFAVRMIAFWQNTMRMGGPAAGGKPSFDTAPTFAARIVFEGRPYTDLFTAPMHTCPTFDGAQFADGECNNGAPVVAGVLTDPGAQAQYYGNLAFRRNRFFQEVFVCRAQPAELTSMPGPVGKHGAFYTSPWPFESIAGTDNGGSVDFHDVSSAVCANCHSTANHRAPLFAHFDENGYYQPTIQVHVPVTGLPFARMSDWLPQTPTPEPTAWKHLVPVKDLGEMGLAMAKDDEVIACAVQRMWNYAMSKGDIVIDAADVPDSVIAPYLTQLKAGNYNLREVLRAILVSDDFVRF